MRISFVFIAAFFLPTIRCAFNTRPGAQVLRDRNWDLLRGERVAVLTNPSGILPDTLEHIVDVFFQEEIDVVGILAPEHGFRGDRQAETGDKDVYTDSFTGFPVYSVYRKEATYIHELLEKHEVSTIVVDIQDTGTRLYTFVWTMFDVIEAASPDVSVIVLDRPNPLGGVIVEGPLLNMSFASRYGKYPIPHRHGCTVGELALMFAAADPSSMSNVKVVAMEHWKREYGWENTGLPFVPPSPNLPTPGSVAHYVATVFLEATTVSEGRGTNVPFSAFGAPWLSNGTLRGQNAKVLTDKLNQNAIACSSTTAARACFRTNFYIPTFQKFNGTVVGGVHWMDDDAAGNIASAHVFARAMQILLEVMRVSDVHFEWDGSWFGTPGHRLMDLYAGTSRLREALDKARFRNSSTGRDIANMFCDEAETFRDRRAAFLLY
eukprot:g1937.t1